VRAPSLRKDEGFMITDTPPSRATEFYRCYAESHALCIMMIARLFTPCLPPTSMPDDSHRLPAIYSPSCSVDL